MQGILTRGGNGSVAAGSTPATSADGEDEPIYKRDYTHDYGYGHESMNDDGLFGHRYQHYDKILKSMRQVSLSRDTALFDAKQYHGPGTGLQEKNIDHQRTAVQQKGLPEQRGNREGAGEIIPEKNRFSQDQGYTTSKQQAYNAKNQGHVTRNRELDLKFNEDARKMQQIPTVGSGFQPQGSSPKPPVRGHILQGNQGQLHGSKKQEENTKDQGYEAKSQVHDNNPNGKQSQMYGPKNQEANAKDQGFRPTPQEHGRNPQRNQDQAYGPKNQEGTTKVFDLLPQIQGYNSPSGNEADLYRPKKHGDNNNDQVSGPKAEEHTNNVERDKVQFDGAINSEDSANNKDQGFAPKPQVHGHNPHFTRLEIPGPKNQWNKAKDQGHPANQQLYAQDQRHQSINDQGLQTNPQPPRHEWHITGNEQHNVHQTEIQVQNDQDHSPEDHATVGPNWRPNNPWQQYPPPAGYIPHAPRRQRHRQQQQQGRRFPNILRPRLQARQESGTYQETGGGTYQEGHQGYEYRDEGRGHEENKFNHHDRGIGHGRYGHQLQEPDYNSTHEGCDQTYRTNEDYNAPEHAYPIIGADYGQGYSYN